MKVTCMNPVRVSSDPEITDTKPCNTEMTEAVRVNWRANFKCLKCDNEVVVGV